MATKIGQFVPDPKEGAYCHMPLDSGERIIVSHDQGGFKGREAHGHHERHLTTVASVASR